MLTGLGAKIMEYDGENRPLSVTYLGKKTCYVYGTDGKRLKKVEGLAPATLCTALPPAANVTTYFGPVEVRNWLGAEQVLTYPQPSIKLTNGVATWLHFDHLGSVRALTDATGTKVESAIYRPFGEQSEWLLPGNPSPETKGWIGERYDADAGLQYLNARYYDPALGMFLQPDWFEVTKPGVGTNRFSYSFNDPVNKFDPGGNQMIPVEEQMRMVLTYPELMVEKTNKRHGANGVAKTTFERDLSWEEGRAMMIDVTQKAISNGAVTNEEGKVVYEAEVDGKFVRVVTMKWMEDIKDPAMVESVLNEIDPQTGVVIASPYSPERDRSGCILLSIEIYATVLSG